MASQGEFQCLEFLDQEVQGYSLGGNLLADVVSNLIVIEVEYHPTHKLFKYGLFPFESFHYRAEFTPI
jgi:hypothetical protein